MLRLVKYRKGTSRLVTFEINDKEYELKLTYKSIKYLNGNFKGGSYELIGKSIQGDIEAFPFIVHAGLFHTSENIAFKTVEERIEELVDNGELTQEDIAEISDKVVTQSGFFKATVDKIMKNNPEMKKGLEQLRGKTD